MKPKMDTIMVERNVPACMRDGVTLYADIYRPAGKGQYPVLLSRMPYGKELMRPMLSQFMDPVRAAQAGYVVIMQDCRGRFTSEGSFGPITQEGPDGYDSVEWAAALPCSNGAVGMWGGSYLGLSEWLAAEQQPPHLIALVPMQAPITSADGVFSHGGVMELPAAVTMVIAFGVEMARRRMTAEGTPPMEIMRATRAIVEAIEDLQRRDIMELPLERLASLDPLGLAECLGPMLARGADPPEYTVDLAKIEVPALIIGGWYDGALPSSLRSFITVRERCNGLARQPHLLVGPWAHGFVGQGRSMLLGEMDFGAAGSGASIDLMADLTAVHLRWFDHWLKGIDNGVDQEPPVQVFIMGENRWRSLPDWPAPETQEKPWYMGPEGDLSLRTPGTAATTSYVYDPADPAPTLGGAGTPIGWHGFGVRDQRPLSARSDVLAFASSPLNKPLTIVGPVSATLWGAASAPDTDFVVRLIDVQPGGYMHNLCDGIVRARYRNSYNKPEWLNPGEIYKFNIDMGATAHTFKPGHRVLVHVTSSNFPRWDRNLNTTDAPGSGIVSQPSQQNIWHGGACPSHVLLPVIPTQ